MYNSDKNFLTKLEEMGYKRDIIFKYYDSYTKNIYKEYKAILVKEKENSPWVMKLDLKDYELENNNQLDDIHIAWNRARSDAEDLGIIERKKFVCEW